MRIAIGADHAGYELKEALKTALRGHDVLDLGTNDVRPVDYPDFAAAVGAAVRDGKAERGVVVCGSGVGASIAANKLRGVRAGLCHDTYSAHQGVEHDDMNVLVLGARVVGVELARELAHAFLGARFSGEARHRRRVAKTVALENRLRSLEVFGQSVWLDFIRPSLMSSGELGRLIERDGVKGVTSNPAIFEKAISSGSEYRDLLQTSEASLLDARALYERLAIADVQSAADALRGVYEHTRRRDGYVSLEVSPLLAHDTAGTLAEARRLWQAVDRSNLMIKVPATPAGIPAVRTLIGEGINVNVTLLFSGAVYAEVAEAYLDGIESVIAAGRDPGGVASVASFFVSRIDTEADRRIAACLTQTADAAEKRRLEGLLGRVAIANAKLAYHRYQRTVSGERWQALAGAGAQTQRLLWASTGTKDPRYRDVVYVEELVGPDTVNTMPPATLEAFRDHGCPRESLTEDVDAARAVLAGLAETGVSLTEITDQLVVEGVRLFADAFERLLEALEARRRDRTAA
jgi:transaldolase/glucose-6-phosphate isomerase